MRKSFSNVAMKRTVLSLATVAALCGWASTPARALTVAGIPFSANYAGTYTGSVIDSGPPIILFTSGVMSDPSAGLGLINGTIAHNTSIASADAFFAPQTIFNGALVLTSGGGELDGTYTGTFLLNAQDTMGAINLDITFTGGSGTLANVVGGTGTASGTAFLTSQFDGTFNAAITGNLVTVPEPASVSLLAVGAIALTTRRSRKRSPQG